MALVFVLDYWDTKLRKFQIPKKGASPQSLPRRSQAFGQSLAEFFAPLFGLLSFGWGTGVGY